MPNPLTSITLPFLAQDKYRAKTEVSLEIIGEQNIITQPFSGMRVLEDLLKAVKNQVAGVDDFLDTINSIAVSMK